MSFASSHQVSLALPFLAAFPTNISAVLTLTIAVGVQDRPAAAPQVGEFVSDFRLVGNPSFTQAISAMSSLVFAFAGTPGFFSIVSEMREPRHYTRSLLVCQGVVTATYIAIGCVVYYFCGSYVASPALGSAGLLMKKVCYGFALPGLIVTTTIVLHVSVQFSSLSDFYSNGDTDPSEVHLCPFSARLQTPYG